MKKIMSLMLGLSLLSGIAVFAQDKPADTGKKTKATKAKTTKAKSTKAKKTT